MDQVVANRGQFVLISSVFAFLNGMGTIPYAMSKAAVEQLGRGLRVELADHGVTASPPTSPWSRPTMIRDGVDRTTRCHATCCRPCRSPCSSASPGCGGDGDRRRHQRRSAAVMQPGRWRPVSALRGLIGPALDARFTTDRRILDVLARLDALRNPHP